MSESVLDGSKSRLVEPLARWAGAAVLVFVSLLYPSAGLAAPMWALGILAVFWAAVVVAVIRRWRRDSWAPAKGSAALIVFWLGLTTIGSNLLDWSP